MDSTNYSATNQIKTVLLDSVVWLYRMVYFRRISEYASIFIAPYIQINFECVNERLTGILFGKTYLGHLQL